MLLRAGRGAPSNVNEGNRRFRDLVSSRKEDYIATGKRQVKNQIAREIVHTIIHARRGRFVRKIESLVEAEEMGVPRGVTAWAIIPLDAAIQKTKQALRDQDIESAKRCTAERVLSGGEIDLDSEAAAAANLGGSAGSSPSLAGQPGPRPPPGMDSGLLLRNARPDLLQSLSQRPDDFLQAMRGDNSKAAALESALAPDLLSPLRGLFERAVAQQQYDQAAAAVAATAANRQDELAEILRCAQQRLQIGASPLSASLCHTLKAMTGETAPSLVPSLSLLSGGTSAAQQPPFSLASTAAASSSSSSSFAPHGSDSLAALLAGRTVSLASAPTSATTATAAATMAGLGYSQALLEAEASERQQRQILDRLVASAAAAAAAQQKQQQQKPAGALSGITSVPRRDETAGEAALRTAAETALLLQGSLPTESPQRYLRLSRLEMQLLEIFCAQGLPVWKARAQEGSSSPGDGTRKAWTWQRLAELVERSPLTAHAPSGLQTLLETSKQAVMLLESVRVVAAADNSQPTRNYQVWFEEELSRWASSLGVVGEHGRPVPFSSQVLLSESSSSSSGQRQPDHHHLYPAGLLDTHGCQKLFEQISCVTRLRSISEKTLPASRMAPKVEFAAAACDRTKTLWSQRPSWWVSEGNAAGDDVALLDMVLREGILAPSNGFMYHGGQARAAASTSKGSGASASLQHLGISKAAVLERVSQLMGHLHDYQVAEDRNEIFEERKEKILELLGGQRRAEDLFSLQGTTPLDSFVARRAPAWDPESDARNKRLRTSL